MKTERMPIIHPHAAGIDVGSRSHFVAVGQQKDQVREFGVYTRDHKEMIAYLQEEQITTIAMESTGSYWQPLFSALQSAGFEVLLVSGRQTKNVRGKTDVKDCQWIQKLHSLGLLRGCFLPESETERLRVLYRHRASMIQQASKMTNKMQKSLRLLNLRLDVVLRDIMGKSGRAIIHAILSGERDGEELAQLADYRVKRSKAEIADALQGHWDKKELLYELEDCYDLYKILIDKVHKIDHQIEQLLEEFTVHSPHDPQEVELTRKQTKGKNQPRINISQLSYRYYGVDLMAIEGVSVGTVLALLSEIGQGIYKFKTAKQFASWLRLAPNNRISGGKVISSRTPKGTNRFAFALRNAANTIGHKKEGALVSFFKRKAFQKGRGAAITATARKLAVIIWNMIVKQEGYLPIGAAEYEEIIRKKKIRTIQKMLDKSGITLSELQTQTS